MRPHVRRTGIFVGLSCAMTFMVADVHAQVRSSSRVAIRLSHGARPRPTRLNA